VPVPQCLYADIEQDTLTGIVITARIPYHRGAVEPHYPKCMDHELTEPLVHYRALVSNFARLSGAYKSGRLGDVAARYPSRRGSTDREPSPLRGAAVKQKDKSLRGIHPAISAPVSSTHRRSCLLGELLRRRALAAEQQEDIRRFLYSRPDLVALCHMNANIDNAWFWREEDGSLRSGLLDRGGVGQMSVASSIWGCIGATEPEMHDRHLHELLDLFIAEYACAGGPSLDRGELAQHLAMHVMMSALHMTTAHRQFFARWPTRPLLQTVTTRSSRQTRPLTSN
jgi:hypothetical protein